MFLNKTNWDIKFEVERSKVKIIWNENVKIVFAHIFVKTGSI